MQIMLSFIMSCNLFYSFPSIQDRELIYENDFFYENILIVNLNSESEWYLTYDLTAVFANRKIEIWLSVPSFEDNQPFILYEISKKKEVKEIKKRVLSRLNDIERDWRNINPLTKPINDFSNEKLAVFWQYKKGPTYIINTYHSGARFENGSSKRVNVSVFENTVFGGHYDLFDKKLNEHLKDLCIK